MYPGHAQFTTRVAAEECGLAPEWNDAFQFVCPVGTRPVQYTPCLSFRCVCPSVCAAQVTGARVGCSWADLGWAGAGGAVWALTDARLMLMHPLVAKPLKSAPDCYAALALYRLSGSCTPTLGAQATSWARAWCWSPCRSCGLLAASAYPRALHSWLGCACVCGCVGVWVCVCV